MPIISNNIDLIAFIVFILAWLGYSIFTHLCKRNTGNLFGTMFEHRLKWMEEAALRDDKAVDAITLGNLMRSVTFFASTSILILAALVPLLSYGEKIQNLTKDLPYIANNTSPMFELKMLLLVIIFIYAFFKYTWALRQYNYASILILTSNSSKAKRSVSVIRNAKILTNAARHFSLGIRSYYFGIAVLSWFVSPYLFIATSILVVSISYRREFLSRALDIISS